MEGSRRKTVTGKSSSGKVFANGSTPLFGCAGICNIEMFEDTRCSIPVKAEIDTVFDYERQRTDWTASFGQRVVYGGNASTNEIRPLATARLLAVLAYTLEAHGKLPTMLANSVDEMPTNTPASAGDSPEAMTRSAASARPRSSRCCGSMTTASAGETLK